MNYKERLLEERRNYNSYYPPGGSPYQTIKKNAIFISSANTVRHELAKSIGAIMLNQCGDIKFSKEMIAALKVLGKETTKVIKEFGKNKSHFITECVPNQEKDRRVDLVRLSDNQRFEFETQKSIKKDNCCTIYI